MRKVVWQIDQKLQVAASGTVTVDGPWIIQPVQGGASFNYNAYGATEAQEAEVSWHVEDLDTATNLRLLRATLRQQTGNPFTGEADTNTISRDVTGELLEDMGQVSADAGPNGLIRLGLQIVNTSASALNLRIRTLVTSAFAPHRAPADVQDHLGYGYAGAVVEAPGGWALPDVLPGTRNVGAAILTGDPIDPYADTEDAPG